MPRSLQQPPPYTGTILIMRNFMYIYIYIYIYIHVCICMYSTYVTSVNIQVINTPTPLLDFKFITSRGLHKLLRLLLCRGMVVSNCSEAALSVFSYVYPTDVNFKQVREDNLTLSGLTGGSSYI
jgi:hypothetical protein